MNRRSFLKSLGLAGSALAVTPLAPASTGTEQHPVHGATRAATFTVRGYGPWRIAHGLNATGLRVRARRISRKGHAPMPCQCRVIARDAHEADLLLVRPEQPGFLARFLDPPVFSVTVFARGAMISSWDARDRTGREVYRHLGDKLDRMVSERRGLVAGAPATPVAPDLPRP